MRESNSTVRLRGDGVGLVADRWTSMDQKGNARGDVVLLHGGGQTRHSWQRTGERIASAGWNAYAVDARGHGDSDWAPNGDYSIAAHARDVRQLSASLPTQPVLIGASMGGMAALTAAGSDHTLARGLVLVDITPRAEPEGLQRIQSFMKSGLEGFESLEDALQAVIDYNPHRKRPPRINGLRKNLRYREGRWYWHWDPRIMLHRENSTEMAHLREQNARAAARRITVPTLLIRGSQSDIVGEEGVRDLLSLIPDSRHLDVMGAGHMISGDDNDVLTEGLSSFLDELAPPPLISEG